MVCNKTNPLFVWGWDRKIRPDDPHFASGGLIDSYMVTLFPKTNGGNLDNFAYPYSHGPVHVFKTVTRACTLHRIKAKNDFQPKAIKQTSLSIWQAWSRLRIPNGSHKGMSVTIKLSNSVCFSWSNSWTYLITTQHMSTIRFMIKGQQIHRAVTTYTLKRICVHIWTNNKGRFYMLYHNSEGFLPWCFVYKLCA